MLACGSKASRCELLCNRSIRRISMCGGEAFESGERFVELPRFLQRNAALEGGISRKRLLRIFFGEAFPGCSRLNKALGIEIEPAGKIECGGGAIIGSLHGKHAPHRAL